MKLFRLFRTLPLFAALALAPPALASCSILQTANKIVTGNVSDVAPVTMNVAKKALAATHTSHKAVADGLVLLVKGGYITPGSNSALTIRKWLDESEALLVAADKLVALGDARGIENKISAANVLIAKVQNAFGGT